MCICISLSGKDEIYSSKVWDWQIKDETRKLAKIKWRIGFFCKSILIHNIHKQLTAKTKLYKSLIKKSLITKSRITNPESRITKSRILNHQIPNPESRIPNPESRIPNPKINI
ncbi:hypothetical protein MB09_05245 [Aequorivita vladivostokensis]|uniref:Uncharacterized protein n=1 Tax=Aequorivita vladivostokensis TaxID=171194 RepID=A0ABR5DJ97_9FLAO|nr:hypothetical protein MB09_05245 [Aequorivita vladivostokensis]